MRDMIEGVVAVPVTRDGKILIIKDGENTGKSEKLGWDRVGERKSIERLMQFVGGVCETDDLIGELVREGFEETQIQFSQTDFVESGVGTLIDHKRANGEVMMVGVSIYWLLLSEETERLLVGNGAVKMTDELQLRERDMIIYGLVKDKVSEVILVEN